MLINLSNHPHTKWSEAQRQEALERWHMVEDRPFPDVDPRMEPATLARVAADIANEIAARHPQAVLCQGEYTMTYALVKELQRRGLRVVAAVSARKSTEETGPNGETVKRSVFRFVAFRPYPR